MNTASAEMLAQVFWELGGEPQSRRLARVLVHERERRAIQTTRQLADVIERVSPRHGKRAHPATRVFQALRIAVNDEIGSLKLGLEAALKILKTRGRLAVITFHSLEDRMVKQFGRALAREYTFEGQVDVPELRQPTPPQARWVARKATQPSELEQQSNPRSRSAQLRVLEKIQ